MAFDPFNDFDEKGYLRNVAGTKNPAIISRLEHNAFAGNIRGALSYLREAREITAEQVQQTHRILFEDVYPWAGQDRSQNAPDLNITKGAISFQLAHYVQQGVAHALQSGRDPEVFKADPGKFIGEMAYAHPFLEGNGRTIMAVFSELSRRAGFHIAWQETDKQQYLQALTREIDDPNKGHLTSYLKPFVRENARGIEHQAQSLTTLPGLSVPVERSDGETQPVLSIVAGPNGAGKSTLTAARAFEGLPIVDPDAISRAINPDNPEAAATRAGKRALDMRRKLLEKQQSFVVETTLSGNSTLHLIDDAKAHGFRIELTFIGLENADLAKARVAGRVASGGHRVSNEEIERRFTRSLENLPEAISKSDKSVLHENSGESPFRKVAELTRETFTFDQAPVWATDAAFSSAQNDLGNAETVGELERATQRAFDAARAGGVETNQLQQEIKNLSRAQTRRQSRAGHDL